MHELWKLDKMSEISLKLDKILEISLKLALSDQFKGVRRLKITCSL